MSSTPATEEHILNQEVVDLLFQISREFRRLSWDSTQGPAESRTGQSSIGVLTMLQLHALSFLKDPKGITMRELASKLQISRASASSLADRLVETGWAQRTTDTNDRRVIHLTLRPESRKRISGMKNRHTAQVEDVLNKLTLHDRQTLARILQIVSSHMSESGYLVE